MVFVPAFSMPCVGLGPATRSRRRAQVYIPPSRPATRAAVPAPPATTALPRGFPLNTPAVFPAAISSTMRWTSAGVTEPAVREPSTGLMWRLIRPSSKVIVVLLFGRPKRVSTSPARAAFMYSSHNSATVKAIFDFLVLPPRIAAVGDRSNQSFGLLSRLLDSEWPISTDLMALGPLASTDAELNDEYLSTARVNSHTKAGRRCAPQKKFGFCRLGRVDHALRQIWHCGCAPSMCRKHIGSKIEGSRAITRNPREFCGPSFGCNFRVL